MADPADVHLITRGEIDHISKCLRHLDQAREALTADGKDETTRDDAADEIQRCADGIYQVIKNLPRRE